MPAYNEEDNIAEAIRRACGVLEGLQVDYELIVVNDGSTDRTYEVAEGEAFNYNGRVKVTGYARPNMGKGFAFKAGFKCVSGEKVVFVDSDLDIDPGQISSYLEALERGDVVIASKWHPRSVVSAPLVRRFLSLCFNVLVRFLVGLRVRDTQSGLKAFKRRALGSIAPLLLVKRYAFDVELLAIATKLLKRRVVELPIKVSLGARFSFREIWLMLIDLFGIVYRLRVLRWYQKNLGKEKPTYKPIIPL